MNNLILKEKTPHKFDMKEMYKSWGLCGYSSSKEAIDSGAFSIVQPTDIETSLAVNIFENSSMVEGGFILASANKVSLYQGPGLPDIDSLLLLRYTREDRQYSDLGGENISALINLDKQQIQGVSRLVSGSDNTGKISIQNAFKSAVKFLNSNASDLIIDNAEMIISELEENTNQALDFQETTDGELKDGYSLGNVSVLWVGNHEEIIKTSSTVEMIGKKVKLQVNDDTQRYAWVIINDSGFPQIFERDIYWDFDNFKRGSQMWLHDGWLLEHHITLLNLDD